MSLASCELETTWSGWRSLSGKHGEEGNLHLLLRDPQAWSGLGACRGERMLDSRLLGWGPSRSEGAEAGQYGARTGILGKVSLAAVAGWRADEGVKLEQRGL